MVNRLRPFLEDLISETQSAFVPGRLITDNAAIAFECFQKIQHSRVATKFIVLISWIWPKRMIELTGGF